MSNQCDALSHTIDHVLVWECALRLTILEDMYSPTLLMTPVHLSNQSISNSDNSILVSTKKLSWTLDFLADDKSVGNGTNGDCVNNSLCIIEASAINTGNKNKELLYNQLYTGYIFNSDYIWWLEKHHCSASWLHVWQIQRCPVLDYGILCSYNEVSKILDTQCKSS